MPANKYRWLSGQQALNKIKHIIEAYKSRLTSIPEMHSFRESQAVKLDEIERSLSQYRQFRTSKDLLIIQQDINEMLGELSQTKSELIIDNSILFDGGKAEYESGLIVLDSLYRSSEFQELEDIRELTNVVLATDHRVDQVGNEIKNELYKIGINKKDKIIADINKVLLSTETDSNKYQQISALLLDEYKEIRNESSEKDNSLASGIKKMLTKKDKNEALLPLQDAARLQMNDFLNAIKRVVIGQEEFWNKNATFKSLHKILQQKDMSDIEKWTKICNTARKNIKTNHGTLFESSVQLQKTQTLCKLIAKNDTRAVEDFFEQEMQTKTSMGKRLTSQG